VRYTIAGIGDRGCSAGGTGLANLMADFGGSYFVGLVQMRLQRGKLGYVAQMYGRPVGVL